MSYPDDLRGMVDEALERAAVLRRRKPTAGLEEAMRYSLLAGGSGFARSWLWPPLGPRRRTRALPANGLCDRADPHLLADPRRPAGDDDDELRRGLPTSHVKFGEDVAILAGDGLFAEAVRLFCEQSGEPARVLAALRELAGAIGVDGMVGGQSSTSPAKRPTPGACGLCTS